MPIFCEEEKGIHRKEKKKSLRNVRSSHPYKPRHLKLSLYRKLKDDSPSSKLLVNLGESLNLPIESTDVLRVQEDLDDLASVLLGSSASTDDLGWVDEVLENLLVDGGEGP